MSQWVQGISVVAAALLAIFVGFQSIAQQQVQPRESTKLELSISNDGHAIVDQQGTVIARFVEGITVRSPMKSAGARLRGCM